MAALSLLSAGACSTFTPTEDDADAGVDASEPLLDAMPDAPSDASTDRTDGADPDGALDATLGARFVFVTSGDMAPSNTSGITNFDAVCTGYAKASTVPFLVDRKFAAWMSTSNESASAHVKTEGYNGDYRLVDATLIASGGADLVSGSLRARINRDERGLLRAGARPWTGTNLNGTLDMVRGNCGEWRSAIGTAGRGSTDTTLPAWTANMGSGCGEMGPIFCFEVP